MLRKHLALLGLSCGVVLAAVSTVEAGGGIFSRLGQNRRAPAQVRRSPPPQTVFSQTSAPDCCTAESATGLKPCMIAPALHPPQSPANCRTGFAQDYQCCIQKHAGNPQIQEMCLELAQRRYQYCMGHLPPSAQPEGCLCDQPYHGCDPSAPPEEFYSCYYNCGYECSGYPEY